MRLSSIALTVAVCELAGAHTGGELASVVAYPDGYRAWSHVKSGLVSPSSKNYSTNGGFRHTYANEKAMIGYRTQLFPEGSVIVVDFLEMRDLDGVYEEGPRKNIDVMVKDAMRFASTGGWGFQRFTGDTKDPAVTPTLEQCYACHNNLKKDDLVLGHYRP